MQFARWERRKRQRGRQWRPICWRRQRKAKTKPVWGGEGRSFLRRTIVAVETCSASPAEAPPMTCQAPRRSRAGHDDAGQDDGWRAAGADARWAMKQADVCVSWPEDGGVTPTAKSRRPLSRIPRRRPSSTVTPRHTTQAPVLLQDGRGPSQRRRASPLLCLSPASAPPPYFSRAILPNPSPLGSRRIATSCLVPPELRIAAF